MLRKEVRRLANRLRSRIALRQKRAKTGQLDAKATLRANLQARRRAHGDPHRDHRLKPKLVVICDISTSMRYCSELMLSLVYALQDLVTKTHAFAFIDHLEYISPDFAGQAGQRRHRRGAGAHAARPLQHRPGLQPGQTSPVASWTPWTAAPR